MTWSEYIDKNYDELVRIARGITSCPYDLVSHTYLRVYDKIEDKEESDKDSYFKFVMWREGTTNQNKFLESHKYRTAALAQVENKTDIYAKLLHERVEFMLFNFNDFERRLFQLYLEGENMSDFCKFSGVSPRTVWKSIERVKEFLKKEI